MKNTKPKAKLISLLAIPLAMQLGCGEPGWREIACILSPPPARGEGAQTGDMDHRFTQVGNTYVFEGCFFTGANPDCLVRVFYDFEHPAHFVTRADSIVLLRRGKRWYDVCYTYRGVFSEIRTTYRKTLLRPHRKILFKMISTEQHGLSLPKVVSSHGYYEIKPEGEGYRVLYFQECTVESRFLKPITMAMARKEALEFLRELKGYVERTCD